MNLLLFRRRLWRQHFQSEQIVHIQSKLGPVGVFHTERSSVDLRYVLRVLSIDNILWAELQDFCWQGILDALRKQLRLALDLPRAMLGRQRQGPESAASLLVQKVFVVLTP